MLNFVHDGGVEQGRIEGRKEEKISIAKNFLKDGLPIEMVSKNTGLSIEELKNLLN